MNYDIIIAGAGSSGCTAAIAAARMGAKVLIIDKNAYLGGMNTVGMVCPIMAFHSGTNQIVKGIPQEIIDRLATKGSTLGHIPDPLGVTSSITPIEPAALRLVYFEMMSEQPGITMLLHSFIRGIEMKDGQLTGITVTNKSGTATYHAHKYIDATGDGDIAALSEVKYEEGRPTDNFSQPMTLMFKVGGVDYKQVIAYMYQNPEQFILSKDYNLEDYLAVSGYFDIVKVARKNGDFNIPRDRVLFFQGIHPGEIFVNTTRVIKLSGISAEELTLAEAAGYNQIGEILEFFKKYLPGFLNSYLIAVADTIGVRESRRFHCQYTLGIEDVYDEKESTESIAVCAFPIDIHDPAGAELKWVRHKKNFCYDIPYGTMVPKKIGNLLITGRCISASHEALASCRITSTVMALGQAAGVAAALAIRKKTSFQELDVSLVQDTLREQGAIPTKADFNNE